MATAPARARSGPNAETRTTTESSRSPDPRRRGTRVEWNGLAGVREVRVQRVFPTRDATERTTQEDPADALDSSPEVECLLGEISEPFS